MTSYDKQSHYITESAGNILVHILFYVIAVCPLSVCGFV